MTATDHVHSGRSTFRSNPLECSSIAGSGSIIDQWFIWPLDERAL